MSDQPKTLAETTQGARNRAQRAAAAAGGPSTFGIGMESGLFESGGRLFDVCACAIFDGQEMHIGYSCAWELPPAVQEKVLKEGMDLTQVCARVSLLGCVGAAPCHPLRSSYPHDVVCRLSMLAMCATTRRSGTRVGQLGYSQVAGLAGLTILGKALKWRFSPSSTQPSPFPVQLSCYCGLHCGVCLFSL